MAWTNANTTRRYLHYVGGVRVDAFGISVTGNNDQGELRYHSPRIGASIVPITFTGAASANMAITVSTPAGPSGGLCTITQTAAGENARVMVWGV